MTTFSSNFVQDGTQGSIDIATEAFKRTSTNNAIQQLQLASQSSDRQVQNAVAGFAADSGNAAKDLLGKVRL